MKQQVSIKVVSHNSMYITGYILQLKTT